MVIASQDGGYVTINTFHVDTINRRNLDRRYSWNSVARRQVMSQMSSQAARHRYLCPGAGITPVQAASLPEKPSIDAQAGSNLERSKVVTVALLPS